MYAEIICSLVIANFFNPSWIDANQERKDSMNEVCVEVASKAIASNVDPIVVVALSYSESRFSRNTKSKVGAIGPLQVIPRWTCPGGKREGCDLVQAGINTIHKHALAYGCGEATAKEARMRKLKGTFDEWWPTEPVCATPDWEKIICHYNSGNKCLSRRFPRLVLKRAMKIEELLHYHIPHSEDMPREVP